MDGYLLIDKPQSWTSFDVVARVRRLARDATGSKVKVGHAGTLDPLATGLLIVLLGKATKQQDRFMKLDKAYSADCTLGSTSTTYDAEGVLTEVSVTQPSRDEIEAVLEKYKGDIEQMPPQFSAIKIDGKRAYELARAGKQAEIKPRNITIHSLRLTEYEYPICTIETEVSSGTYIRSLCHDIGQELGVGAYISALRRTRIGMYSIADAISIDELTVDNLASSVKAIADR